jgi:tRNA pseudouridine38-40 synthase
MPDDATIAPLNPPTGDDAQAGDALSPLPPKQPRRNIKMVIAYDGSLYHGWQRQAAGVDTVQLRVEQAAQIVLRHPVIVRGTSRTDAGVHAQGQVANLYTTNFAIPLRGLRRAMNANLPRDIAVRSMQVAPDEFSASGWAIGKTYRYRIHVAPARPVLTARQVYHYWRSLDIQLMRSGAERLVGRHDFRGFATSSEARENTVRTIFRCEVSQQEQEIHIHVQGDGFLYNMVRNIVGTLMDVGRRRWPAERIDEILASGDRKLAGPTAPPEGLCLMCVHFQPEEFKGIRE